MRFDNRPSWMSALVLTTSMAACGLEPGMSGEDPHGDEPEQAEPGGEPVDEASSAVLGARTYQTTCNAEDAHLNEKMIAYGRTGANSNAFAQCLQTAMSTGFGNIGPYRKCADDPYFSATAAEQYTRALAATRSSNGLSVLCEGGSGLASTDIGSYNKPGDESFAWASWFRAARAELDRPTCPSNTSPCRWQPEPWPYDQGAAIVWHEALHQQGYGHGANDQDAAKINCGYAGDATWHFQWNTLPYIVGHCMGHVLSTSGVVCGDVESCGPNRLRLIDGLSSTTCTCVNDPSPDVADLATFTTKNIVLADFPTWISEAGVQVVSGDFDGDGRADLAAAGGATWASVPVAFSRGDGSFRVTNAGVSTFPARARTPGAKLVAGDFDKDGRDDLALVGGQGWTSLTVAISTGDGGFTVSDRAAGNFAIWSATANVQALAGDFDGDGRSDIALLGGAGWNTVPVALARADGSFFVTNNQAGSFPAWSRVSGAQAAVGDFNGDGHSDLALAGGAGWGSIPLALGTTDGNFYVTNEGVPTFPAQAAIAGSQLRAADFDGDGLSDLVVRGQYAWIARSSGDGRFTSSIRDIGSQFAQWSVGSRLYAADFDANGRADLALARVNTPGWQRIPMLLSALPDFPGSEYNDYRDDATLLPTGYFNASYRSIGYRADRDYYAIDITSTRYFWAYMTLEQIRGDLDMVLVDARGAPIISSTSSSNTESFTTLLTPGRYYLKVYGYVGGTGIYHLTTTY